MAKDRIRVTLRSFDAALVDKSARAIVTTVKEAGGETAGPICLPTRVEKFTVLRSPHVNKKSREQFEMRTHKRLIDILDASPKVREALIKIELSDGVEVEMKN